MADNSTNNSNTFSDDMNVVIGTNGWPDIITCEFPSLDSINITYIIEKNRRKTKVECEWTDLIEGIEWNPVKVYDNHDGENVVDDDVRSGTHNRGELKISNYDYRHNNPMIVKMCELFKMSPDYLGGKHNPENEGESFMYDALNYTKILKYETGDHFAPHTDVVDDTIAVVIIMIPGYEHTGGILRVTDSHGVVHEFDANVDVPTFVAFKPSLLHEVTPVISGTRIVVKDLICHYSEDLIENILNCQTKYEVPEVKNNNDETLLHEELKAMINSDIDSVKESIDTIIANLEKLNSLDNNRKENDIFEYDMERVDNLTSTNGLKTIVLKNYYPEGNDTEYMYQKDIEIINHIHSNPNCKGSYVTNRYREVSHNSYDYHKGDMKDFGKTSDLYKGGFDHDDGEKVVDIYESRNCGKRTFNTRYNDSKDIDTEVSNLSLFVFLIENKI